MLTRANLSSNEILETQPVLPDGKQDTSQQESQANREFDSELPDANRLAQKESNQEEMTPFEKALLEAYREFTFSNRLTLDEIRSAAYLRAKSKGRDPSLGTMEPGQIEYLYTLEAKAFNPKRYKQIEDVVKNRLHQ